MKVSASLRAMFAIPALLALTAPASAHHAMDGKLPSTFMEGLLSGLAHPIIGPDHFAFILAIGLAAALVPAGLGLIGAFVLASTAGVIVHLGLIAIPFAEPLIAASVIAAAALLALGRENQSRPWLLLAVFAGLFHGYAFGESIVGAERNVLGAYLIGLAAVSVAVAAAVTMLARHIVTSSATELRLVRAASAALGLVGIALLAGNILSA